jgi:hypothetical protein
MVIARKLKFGRRAGDLGPSTAHAGSAPNYLRGRANHRLLNEGGAVQEFVDCGSLTASSVAVYERKFFFIIVGG